MIYLIIVLCYLLLTKATCSHCYDNVGSVLFYKRDSDSCWSKENLSKLRARMIFEDIVLPAPTPDKMTAKHNRDTIKYFKKAFRLIESNKDAHTKEVLKEVLADTIGGHMRKEMLPNARFAYYAGYIPYRSVRELHDFFDYAKSTLNTQGYGWKRPDKIPLQTNLTVAKILISAGKPFDPCSSLVIKRYHRNCIYIASPTVDDEKRPTAVALPFKSGGFVSLKSPSSENILLKYYATAARCILRSSPDECRHTDFVNFNNGLWHWMKRYVAPHLMDEELYAGYGGILRIAAAVQNYGQGLTRRNIFESYAADSSEKPKSNNFWCRKYCFDFNTNTTMSIVYLILMVAAAVCFLHICYNFMCGPAGGCNCSERRRSRQKQTKAIYYATVDSNLPSVLCPHSTQRCSEETTKRRSRPASVSTTLNQKIYDLNENKEKVMSIIMNDKETCDTEQSTTEDDTFNRTIVASRRSPVSHERTPRSPPKIVPSMAQLKIEKTPQRTGSTVRKQALFSTSTLTNSEVTHQASESGWSGSCTTDNSGSSVGLLPHVRKLRRSSVSRNYTES